MSSKLWAWVGILTLAGLNSAIAREDLAVQPRIEQLNRQFIARVASDCTPPGARISLDINNVRALILRANDMWWDQGGSFTPRYEIPKLDDITLPKKHSLFAGSIWIGGFQNSSLRVAVQTYRQASTLGIGWWAGPLTIDSANITRDECRRWDTHWKVERSQIQTHINAIAASDPTYVIPDAIRKWPWQGDVTLGQDPKMAPFVDVDADGIYNPSLG
ncbi:MAG: hypothetical protein Q8J69_07200, partial [Sphingobacteriaceae bacterium]|nr:hypothetical protein [Sphingobacteriaceae bacterium]